MFHDVSFDLRRGEILGIAGLVGSGRTNVAETIFGVTPATSGEIRIDGQPVTVDSPDDRDATTAWRFLTEDRKETGCFLILDVLENMQMAVLHRHYVKGGFVKQGAVNALCEEHERQRCGSRRRRCTSGSRTSRGGNQQKVLIGRWLLTKPAILILDEPTRGIDVGAKAEIHRLISELAGEGVAVIMISSETAGNARHERPHHGHARGPCHAASSTAPKRPKSRSWNSPRARCAEDSGIRRQGDANAMSSTRDTVTDR